MELLIYAKKRKTKEGREFSTYLTTLKKKTGEEQTMGVRFRDECGSPSAKDCPMYINVDKSDANVSQKKFTREDTGEPGISYTLWISKWSKGREYIDTSMDEFDV